MDSTQLPKLVDEIVEDLEEAWAMCIRNPGRTSPDIAQFLRRGEVLSQKQKKLLIKELVCRDSCQRTRKDGSRPDRTVYAEMTELFDHGDAIDSGMEIAETGGRPTLSDYEVCDGKALGKGGFGVVWKATRKSDGMAVAIKTLLPDMLDEAHTFFQEAQLQQQLDHDRILKIVEVTRDETGRMLIVTPLMDRGSLKGIAKLSEPEAASVVVDVCEGLSYLHRKGHVHRDIKPANILRDSSGAIVIADFGLSLNKNQLGASRAIAGSPAYMSPEQLKPESLFIDPANSELRDRSRPDYRSDIYSLGIVLIKLVTGQHPYIAAVDDPKARRQLLDEIGIDGIAQHEEWQNGISQKMLDVCRRATRFDKEDRFQTAEEFASALRPLAPPKTCGKLFSTGPLEANAASYVYRECDAELTQLLLANNSATMICGPPQSGKTSLARQAGRILGSKWLVIKLETALARPDDSNRFMGRIYELISDAYSEEIGNLSDLASAARRRPCAIILDEIGHAELRSLELLFEGFDGLLERLEELDHTNRCCHILATHPTYSPKDSGVRELIRHRCEHEEFPLEKHKLWTNPRFIEELWVELQVPPFTKENAIELLQRLPNDLSSLIRRHIDTVLSLAATTHWEIPSISPKKLQSMLVELHTAFTSKASVENLELIVTDPKMYAPSRTRRRG